MHACSAFIVVVNIRINKIKFKAVERLLLLSLVHMHNIHPGANIHPGCTFAPGVYFGHVNGVL